MVAVVVQADAIEAIPLLDNNGSGVYNKGRNNIDDFRKYFLGGLFGKSASSAFANKNGLLSVTNDSAGSWADGSVYSTGGAGTQAVNVNPFRALVNRTGRGPSIVIQDAILLVNAPAADTLPRRDLLCVMPYDQGAFVADAQHGPKFIWVTGDPNASPTTPALPAAVADAMILALVARGGSDNTIAPADITSLQSGASLHGVARTLLGGDLVTDAGRYHGEIRALNKDYVNVLDTAALARGHTMWYDYWDGPSATWKPISRTGHMGQSNPAGNGALNTGEQMDLSVTFNAISGRKYKMTTGYGVSTNADGASVLFVPRYAAGASVTTSGTAIESTRLFRANISQSWVEFTNIFTAPSTAQYTVGIGVYVFAGGVSGTVYGQSAGNGRQLLVETVDA